MNKIILYGGSFDPIHLGHLFVAKNALSELKADRVVFIPASAPRWKELESSSSDRLNMLKLAIEDYKEFEINEIELNSTDEVNYTYNTVKSIVDDNNIYYLLIGSDQLNKLDAWYEIDKLSKLINIVCYKRISDEINIDNAKKYNVTILNGEYFNQSSSEIRKGSKLYTPKSVLNYIEEHDLYYIKKIKSLINEKRYKHSISVAHLSYHIAQNNSLDAHKAYLSALLHDIGKYVSNEETAVIMKEFYPNDIDLPSYSYHQFIGEYIAKNLFDVTDEEILDAIKYHCTGKANMSPYAKIIYASDKIDPLRGYDSRYMINACLENIETGFKLVLKENIKYFIIKNVPYINRLTDECIRYYRPLKGN